MIVSIDLQLPRVGLPQRAIVDFSPTKTQLEKQSDKYEAVFQRFSCIVEMSTEFNAK